MRAEEPAALKEAASKTPAPGMVHPCSAGLHQFDHLGPEFRRVRGAMLPPGGHLLPFQMDRCPRNWVDSSLRLAVELRPWVMSVSLSAIADVEAARVWRQQPVGLLDVGIVARSRSNRHLHQRTDLSSPEQSVNPAGTCEAGFRRSQSYCDLQRSAAPRRQRSAAGDPLPTITCWIVSYSTIRN